MRPSKFIFRTTNPDTSEILLYNTLNGSLLAFEEANLKELDFVLKEGISPLTETPLTRLLTEEEFLVGDSYDEINMVLERNQLGITDENRLDVFIMPNMNCNFACPYCYEEHHTSQMSQDVQQRLIDWFTLMVPRFKAVLINWFGGEPLMSYGAIVTLQEKLTAICNQYDIPCISHITTNGYLLNPGRIHKLLDLGVTSYQITVDGAPDNHNQTRILKDGSGTFDRIFNNIVSLASDSRSKIRLRVNYDDKNINSIKELLNILPQEIRPRLELNCERIFGQEYGVFENDEINHGQIIAELYQYAFELGYDIGQDEISPGKLTYCYADRMNQFLFNYTGDVFKCTVGKFKPEQRLGYLNANGEITWEKNKLNSWHDVNAFEDKCYSCTFMPLCMGGCRKVRHLFGSVGDDCKLPFEGFDDNVRNLYKQLHLSKITS